MGVLFCDGFDSASASTDLAKKGWGVASPWSWASGAGRNGGGAAVATTASSAILRSPAAGAIVASGGTICFGFYAKLTAKPASIAPLVQVVPSNLNNSTFGCFKVDANGFIAVTASFGSTPALATGIINIADGNFHWIEILFVVSASAIVVHKVMVDTVQQFTVTGSLGSNTASDSILFYSVLGATLTIDDPVFYDDQSPSPKNTDYPLGPRQITTIRPQADSSIGFSTATGGGTHFDQLDEISADGDGSYVESTNSGDKDFYDFAAMGISPATINAVVSNAYVENPNPGSINFRQNAKSGATTTNGATVQAPSNYRNVQQSFSLDPNTGAAWASASAVDNATFGPEIV